MFTMLPLLTNGPKKVSNLMLNSLLSLMNSLRILSSLHSSPSGEKFEKNATAIPRQSGYLDTARAMYEYVYYKDDEVAQARGMSTSVGTLPILQEANYLRITSSFIVVIGLTNKV